MASANEKRKLAVAYMKSRAGKNSYTQGGKRSYFFGYPDNVPGNSGQSGYSDCSAAVMKAIHAAAGISIGSNTSAQIGNRTKGLVVDETNGYYPDESKLLPGDCLYFKGNASHPMDVGHVEMYTGPNECYGHGSGKGPTKKDLKKYCKSRATAKKRYFMAIRWILENDEPGSDERGELLVKPGKWNLRLGPGTGYASAGTVQGGQRLKEAENGGWKCVEVDGRILWISIKALESEGA